MSRFYCEANSFEGNGRVFFTTFMGFLLITTVDGI